MGHVLCHQCSNTFCNNDSMCTLACIAVVYYIHPAHTLWYHLLPLGRLSQQVAPRLSGLVLLGHVSGTPAGLFETPIFLCHLAQVPPAPLVFPIRLWPLAYFLRHAAIPDVELLLPLSGGSRLHMDPHLLVACC